MFTLSERCEVLRTELTQQQYEQLKDVLPRQRGNVEEPEILSRPIAGRVFFAGEALHLHDPGTVHGAYWTGQRAARQVQAQRT